MVPDTINKWQDVQHQHMVIAQRAAQRHVLHAVVAMAATAAAIAIRPRPTLHRRGAAEEVRVAAAGPALLQGRAGHAQVLPWYIRLPKCER